MSNMLCKTFTCWNISASSGNRVCSSLSCTQHQCCFSNSVRCRCGRLEVILYCANILPPITIDPTTALVIRELLQVAWLWGVHCEEEGGQHSPLWSSSSSPHHFRLTQTDKLNSACQVVTNSGDSLRLSLISTGWMELKALEKSKNCILTVRLVWSRCEWAHCSR